MCLICCLTANGVRSVAATHTRVDMPSGGTLLDSQTTSSHVLQCGIVDSSFTLLIERFCYAHLTRNSVPVVQLLLVMLLWM